MTQTTWDLIFYLGNLPFSDQPWDPGGYSILGEKKSDGPSIWRKTPAGSQRLDCEKSVIRKPLEV